MSNETNWCPWQSQVMVKGMIGQDSLGIFYYIGSQNYFLIGMSA